MRHQVRGLMRTKCRCGNILIANLCFGCDNTPDNCSCLEMVYARTHEPPMPEHRIGL
jgi:hypothetical protein